MKPVSVYGAVADMCGELARDSKKYGETQSDWESRINGYTDRISYCQSNCSDWCQTTRRIVTWIWAEIRRTSWTREIDQTTSAPMVVSLRILGKDNFSLHLMMRHLTNWWDHFESTLYFEAMNHPTCNGGSLETRRSVQSWIWWSVIIMDVTVWKSWSNLHFVTEQLLPFVSWTESTNT